MSKKLLLVIIFGALTVILSLFISLTIDPETSQYSKNITRFHQNAETIFYGLTVFEDFNSKIDKAITDNQAKADETAKLTAFKTQFTQDFQKIKEIYDTKIDPQGNDDKGAPKTNVVAKIESISEELLATKTATALAGITEVLALASQIEKSVPDTLKDAYTETVTFEKDGQKINKINELNKLHSNTPKSAAGTKMIIKVLLILLVGLAAAAVFIMLEMKARKTGEIKPSEL